MAADGGEQRRSTDVPDADRAVDGSGGQEAIVGTEGAVHFLITVIRADVTQFQVPGPLGRARQASFPTSRPRFVRCHRAIPSQFGGRRD